MNRIELLLDDETLKSIEEMAKEAKRSRRRQLEAIIEAASKSFERAKVDPKSKILMEIKGGVVL